MDPFCIQKNGTKPRHASTLTYLTWLASTNNLPYHLLLNNCVQTTWQALSRSNVMFGIANCPTIPDCAYAKMLLMNLQFSKFRQFVAREALYASAYIYTMIN